MHMHKDSQQMMILYCQCEQNPVNILTYISLLYVHSMQEYFAAQF